MILQLTSNNCFIRSHILPLVLAQPYEGNTSHYIPIVQIVKLRHWAVK